MRKITNCRPSPRWNKPGVGVALAATLGVGLGVLTGTLPASAQTTTFNNNGTDFNNAANYTNGAPDANTTAQFIPFFPGIGTTVQQPVINASASALSLIVGNAYPGNGNYTFSGTSSLTLGGTGSVGLTTYGTGTTTFNGPTLAGLGVLAPNALGIQVNTSTSLTFSGATAITTNPGTITANGGTFTLDNSGTNTADRLGSGATLAAIALNGGTFSVIGNSSAATSINAGILNTTIAPVANNSGSNTVLVNANGGPGTTITFANPNTGTPPTGFSLRSQTFMVLNFQSASGVLGTTGGGFVKFVGTPFVGASGLLATTAGGATVGFATVTDANGKNFATYNGTGTGGNGIVAVTPNLTTAVVAGAGGLQSSTAANAVQFNPGTGTQTATATITAGSLRITPSAAGAVLNMGTNTLATNALMLDGANDFTLSGTGSFVGSATRYIYVNNANTTLNISLNIASGTNPTDFVGPGFINLTGAGTQNTISGANRLNFLGGTVRASNTQFGFTATGTGTSSGSLAFRGGVLEITGGTNGVGAAADFTRNLSPTNAQGAVNWNASATAGDTLGGSGGFSAFGNTASVNITGQSTPTTLTWATGGFVGNGNALLFGSTQSNARLNFLNNIALDGGTVGNYAEREIRVIAGTSSASFTDIQGVVSGSSSTDLLKTGTGTLRLSGANTYAGNTFINGGTLLAQNAAGSATGTGTTFVNSGGTLAGTGTVGGVVLNTGGFIKPGDPTAGGTATGTLTSSALTLAGGSFGTSLAGFALGSDMVMVTGIFNTTGAATTFNFTGGTAGTQYNLVQAGSLGTGFAGNNVGTFSAVGTNGTFGFNGNTLVFTVAGAGAVPEPGTWALVLMGGGTGAGALALRRLRLFRTAFAA